MTHPLSARRHDPASTRRRGSLSRRAARFSLALGVAALAASGLGSDVHAQGLGSRNVAAERTRAVTVQGAKTMPLGTLADLAFADARAKSASLASGRGLMAPAVTNERFTETASEIVFEHSVSFTVTDPPGLRANGGRFASFHADTPNRGNFSAAKMKPAAKKGFDAFKAKLAQKPANHPLRIAMAGGDDALLDAIAQGKGDVRITTRLAVEKTDRPMTGRTASFPAQGPDGWRDYGKSVARTFKIVPPSGTPATKADGVAAPLQSATTDGSETYEARFLTGFTKAESVDWEERWDFGDKDYFAIGFHADYAFGLRIPFKVKGVLSPAKVSTRIKDTAQPFTVRLSADTLDANEQYYLDAGLSKLEAAKGRELVLEASAHAKIDVEAGWGTISIHQKIPENLGFDFGQDFKPPFGDCGTSCGIKLWVPPDVTNTQINLLGVVKGSAELGFNVGGDGTVEFDYGALYDESSGLTSSYAGQTAKAHHFGLTSPSNGKLLTSTLPVLTQAGSKKYGWQVSNPVYRWDVTVTPGIRGRVSVKAKPFFSFDEIIGPFWLDGLSFKLGSFKFSTHAGTANVIQTKAGTKTFMTIPTPR